jgi:hypothetical protein
MSLISKIFEENPNDVYAVIEALKGLDDSPVARATVGIYRDVMDRGGLRQEFDGFDDDIKVEIVQRWAEIIESALS